MSMIVQKTQTSLARFLTQLARGIDVDRRDALRRTEWRPGRWAECDMSSRGL
jgi:hypothetical protein